MNPEYCASEHRYSGFSLYWFMNYSRYATMAAPQLVTCTGIA